jgi:proteasome accessory factor B
MHVSRIYRLLKLVTLLQSGRSLTADDLAGELDVSRRTVFRDLNMLELAHIPYYFDPDENSYRIAEHFFLQPVNLTLAEALSLMLLAGRLRSSSQLPLLDAGTRAAMKLESVLPPAIRRHVGSVSPKIDVALGPLGRHTGLQGVFDELLQAADTHRVCRLIYLSFHESRQIELTVHPLRLQFVGRAWYCIAFCPKWGENRTFKLARIRKVQATDETFTPPKADRTDEPFGQAWSMIPEGRLYDIHLRFGPKVAGNVAEVRWHSSQETTFRDDGSLDFRARVDGIGEILWWILGYGPHVQVLAPEALRDRVAEAAGQVASLYDRPTTPESPGAGDPGDEPGASEPGDDAARDDQPDAPSPIDRSPGPGGGTDA